MKPILLVFSFAAALAGQNFIQMSDPQFGMFTKDASFEHETANFEFAISIANRLQRTRGEGFARTSSPLSDKPLGSQNVQEGDHDEKRAGGT